MLINLLHIFIYFFGCHNLSSHFLNPRPITTGLRTSENINHTYCTSTHTCGTHTPTYTVLVHVDRSTRTRLSDNNQTDVLGNLDAAAPTAGSQRFERRRLAARRQSILVSPRGNLTSVDSLLPLFLYLPVLRLFLFCPSFFAPRPSLPPLAAIHQPARFHSSIP